MLVDGAACIVLPSGLLRDMAAVSNRGSPMFRTRFAAVPTVGWCPLVSSGPVRRLGRRAGLSARDERLVWLCCDPYRARTPTASRRGHCCSFATGHPLLCTHFAQPGSFTGTSVRQRGQRSLNGFVISYRHVGHDRTSVCSFASRVRSGAGVATVRSGSATAIHPPGTLPPTSPARRSSLLSSPAPSTSP